MREIEKNSIRHWLSQLEKVDAKAKNAGLWAYALEIASRPRRQRVAVNLTKLERNAKEGENIVVPGKLLGGGAIKKGLNITAIEYSTGAQEKIRKANGKVLTLEEMMKKESVRIIV